MTDKKGMPAGDRSDRLTAARSLVDLLVVFLASGVAFFVEQWANARGLVSVPEAATGVSAVIAGFVTAVVVILIRKQSLSEIGFRRPARWAHRSACQFIELPAPDLSRYDSIYQNLPAALTMALLLPLTASIPEELIYRGFLMDRLTRIFGSNAAGNFLTVLVQALIFGAIHFQWGWGGVLVTTIMGAIWGTAFLLCGRNLWIVILAHSAGHMLMVAQLYFVKASELGTG